MLWCLKRWQNPAADKHTRAGWMISAESWRRYHDFMTDTETPMHTGRGERMWANTWCESVRRHEKERIKDKSTGGKKPCVFTVHACAVEGSSRWCHWWAGDVWVKHTHVCSGVRGRFPADGLYFSEEFVNISPLTWKIRLEFPLQGTETYCRCSCQSAFLFGRVSSQ